MPNHTANAITAPSDTPCQSGGKTDAVYRLYLNYRKDGYSARSAAREATAPIFARPPIEWNGDGRAELSIGIYTVRLKAICDNYPDLSWYGEFSDKPGKSAIDRKQFGDWTSRQFRYWNPAEPYREIYDAFRKSGYARHSAHNKARQCLLQCYRRHLTYGDAWNELIVTATAFIMDSEKRIEIECGSASCGGVDSDDSRYRDEIAHDLALEAVANTDDNTVTNIRRRATEIHMLTL